MLLPNFFAIANAINNSKQAGSDNGVSTPMPRYAVVNSHPGPGVGDER